MLITIRRVWLLRIFGWGLYMGRPRKPEEYPSEVRASLRLWLHWLRHGVRNLPFREDALSQHKIEI